MNFMLAEVWNEPLIENRRNWFLPTDAVQSRVGHFCVEVLAKLEQVEFYRCNGALQNCNRLRKESAILTSAHQIIASHHVIWCCIHICMCVHSMWTSIKFGASLTCTSPYHRDRLRGGRFHRGRKSWWRRIKRRKGTVLSILIATVSLSIGTGGDRSCPSTR